MDLDDPLPKKPAQGPAIGESLEALSIGELESRVKVLEVEIARVRDEIKRKAAHNAAASAIFKS